eukprot:Phypoly_transcript_13064.p1 GENE.Phypoly_transcript_13064~~Phypoly_transcript_13064.p1  ORF type:complete len:223 (+),score=48.09 Phypoly_transcript_13064:372-1040(+)
MKPKMEGDDEVFADVISFLGLVSDSPYARGSVMKSALFFKCVEIVQKQALHAKHAHPLRLMIALQLLISLSFEQDAQVTLVKAKGFLDSLFDLLESREETVRLKCMFLLRNLSFAPANKPFFLSHDHGLRLITNGVTYPNVKMQCYSTSLLASLLSNNQRASVKFKKMKGLVDELQQMTLSLSAEPKENGVPSQKQKHKSKYQKQTLEQAEMILQSLGMRAA